MFTIKNYAQAQSLEEAYELLHKNRNNVILGGLMWMKMTSKKYHTGIDLSHMKLNRIEEVDGDVHIGCMVTFRDIEKSDWLIDKLGTILKDSVNDVVGVQFRNSATVGASIFSKFGFSDLLTALLVLDAKVDLFHNGIMDLSEFIDTPVKKDILTKIIIPIKDSKAVFKSQRYTKTDFSIVNVGIAKDCDKWIIAVGARPAKARLALKASACLSDSPTEEEIMTACNQMADELSFGDNLKASGEYRKELAKILMKRGIEELCI